MSGSVTTINEQQIIRIVELARAGDREVFCVLAQRFDAMVFGIVPTHLCNRSEVREVTQDVFMQTLGKLPQLRESERFVG